jgi:hypothetical protein
VDAPVEKLPTPWQPFTPAGVAAFANASWRRLVLVQFVFALAAAAAAVWFLAEDWFPVVTRAIGALPTQGEIRRGVLDWREEPQQLLAENGFLGLSLDLSHSRTVRSSAHVQIEFGRADVKVLSLFGFWQTHYPATTRVPFNRPELGPWWGAWAPPILAAVAVVVIFGLMTSWAFLSTLYFLPAWLIGFFGNRVVTLGGAWRITGAALMPGAILLTVAIVFYGLGAIDVLRLTVAAGLHLLLSWIYVMAGALSLPRDRAALSLSNPFARPTPSDSIRK